jgi:nitroreductase
MSDPYSAVWAIDERDFPRGGAAAEVLRFVQRYAILAPSGHNGQPWSFRIGQDVLQVRADRSRALPMVDPCDREMLISCAATIHLTRVALEHFGYHPAITLLPDPADPDLLATIHPGRRAAPPADRALFDAILARHSNRYPYQARPVTGEHIARLAAAAAAEGAWLQPVTDPATITAAAALIAAGDRVKWRDPQFRHELADRLVPNRGHRRDGMPGYAFGIPGPIARLAPAVIRHADLGRLRASADRKLALATPCLAVIGTSRDDPPAWLAAGQAMSAVLLQATADGLATSFLSQAIEVEALRPRLAALTGHDGHPQLLLRVGYPRRPAPPAPRCPLDDVLAPFALAGSPVAAAQPRAGAPR